MEQFLLAVFRKFLDQAVGRASGFPAAATPTTEGGTARGRLVTTGTDGRLVRTNRPASASAGGSVCGAIAAITGLFCSGKTWEIWWAQ